jgi:uncharacterized protein (DUF885 family)
LSFAATGPNIHAPALLWSAPIMRPATLSAFVLAACLAAPHAIAAEDAAKALHDLFDAGWERSLREDPFFATYLGDPRYDDQLPDESLAAIDASNDADRRLLADVEAIPSASLTPGTSSTASSSFACMLMRSPATSGEPSTSRSITWTAYRTSTRPRSSCPFATVKDYENWLARMGKFSKLMDQNIELMRDGIAKKMVQPRVIMERVPPQIATQLVDDPTASPVLRAVQDHARLDPGCRADPAARRRVAGDQYCDRAGVPAASTISSARSTCPLPATPWVSAISRAARRGISDASAGSQPPT